MKTTQQRKNDFISQGSEISNELINIFGRDAAINIADIGACEGLSTIIYSRLFPRSKFISFEPIPKNYDEMITNYKAYHIDNRVLFSMPIALSDRNETVTMWRSQGDAPGVVDWETGNKSNSLLKPKTHLKEHKWCDFKNDINVATHRLDDIMSSTNFLIDFAHIDVQGAELKVLKGGRTTFKYTKAVWLEVANTELYDGQPLKRDIQIYMTKIGFRCIKDTCGKGKSGDMLWRR